VSELFFNTPRWVLFFLSVAAFLQGMIINGLINTVITSIERRFDLHSYETGLIVSSYDIASCICLVFVSYFGGTGHKPRWLGWGVLIMALGSLVFALPHFTSPPYQASLPEQTGMCSANHTSSCQNKEGGEMSNYRFVFMLGQFLHGIGATPIYTLGVTYLDENVNSKSAPVYVGVFYTAAVLGPAVGYLLGGYFLSIFTEIHLTTEMTPEDPHWIGAWWIGFLAGGAAALLISKGFSLDLNLTVDCNADCSCIRELYNPVCGADDMMYYSPCHAGCTSINHTDVSTGKQNTGVMVAGNVPLCSYVDILIKIRKCGNSCDLLPVFLPVFFIAITFTFLCQSPTVTAILRCVPDSQRSFALGIQLIVMRTLGTIPGPIAFGAMIDISCLLWQDKCGEQGSCYLYQNSDMSRYILITAIIYKVALGAIFFLLASILYKPPPESPQNSCESSDQGKMSELPIKDPPEDGVIVNPHARSASLTSV
uniref:Solute carrier organic anion transporter family, member 4A1 n=1 Tax=Acanthochromis polyacanthus TaxID=80966 RepID=A0A3Q1FD73_9TELE